MRQRSQLLLALLLSLVLLLNRTRAADPKETDNIDGTWLPSAAELEAKQYPDDVRKSIKLEVKDGKYTVTVGDAVDKGTVKLDTTAKPMSLDITGSEGPNKGKTILAIFERDGDTLRICYDLSGKTRPTEFKTTTGSKLFLVTYQLQKTQ